MKSRFPLWLSLLVGLFVVQISWWGRVIWVQADRGWEIGYQFLEQRHQYATFEWQSLIAEGIPEAQAWAEISAASPGILYRPPLADAPAGGRGVLQVSVDALHKLDRRRFSQHRMVAAESTLFLVLGLFGVGLLVRTYRREAYLSLQQSNFLHAVTHEFRSPLQSLRLVLETLIRRPDPKRAREYADGMLEDIARLETMVDNVLAVGRLDAEAFRARTRPTDLAPAIQRIAERVAQDHPERPDLVEFELAQGLVADLDPSTLQPVVRNLLDNAVKYGEGKPVKVRLVQAEGWAELHVRDAGRGLSREDLPHVFDRFWRSGDERTRTAPGVGLGLFLVKQLLVAQGASVKAHSDGPGTGSEFVVRWPIAAASGPA